MKRLKYAVEIEIDGDIYTLLKAASHYGDCPITVPEAFRQIIEESITDNAFDPNKFKATVTYIEQEEQ